METSPIARFSKIWITCNIFPTGAQNRLLPTNSSDLERNILHLGPQMLRQGILYAHWRGIAAAVDADKDPHSKEQRGLQIPGWIIWLLLKLHHRHQALNPIHITAIHILVCRHLEFAKRPLTSKRTNGNPLDIHITAIHTLVGIWNLQKDRWQAKAPMEIP